VQPQAPSESFVDAQADGYFDKTRADTGEPVGPSESCHQWFYVPRRDFQLIHVYKGLSSLLGKSTDVANSHELREALELVFAAYTVEPIR